MEIRKVVSLIVVIGMLVGTHMPCFASTQVPDFYLNSVRRWDVKVVIKNNVTYVPLRIVGEELGAQVKYEAKGKQVTIAKNNKELKIQLGKKEAILNGKSIEMENVIITQKNEKGNEMVYIPLRNIFDTFDGVVDYNKAYNYISAYNKNHIAYKALQGLKSEDLTTYRFAQLALPRINGEGMGVYDGRVIYYFFPLNKKTDYFFIGTDPSGDMNISTMAYLEIENGAAICKWYKQVSGEVKGKINPLNNSINTFLGNRTVVEEIGEFPKLEEKYFISFSRYLMIEPATGEELGTYKDIFLSAIQVHTPQGGKCIPEGITVESPIRNPYLFSYEEKMEGVSPYKGDHNTELLSKVDETSLELIMKR